MAFDGGWRREVCSYNKRHSHRATGIGIGPFTSLLEQFPPPGHQRLRTSSEKYKYLLSTYYYCTRDEPKTEGTGHHKQQAAARTRRPPGRRYCTGSKRPKSPHRSELLLRGVCVGCSSEEQYVPVPESYVAVSLASRDSRLATRDPQCCKSVQCQ